MRRRHDLIGTHVDESLEEHGSNAPAACWRTWSRRPGESSLRSWFIPATWPRSALSPAVRER